MAAGENVIHLEVYDRDSWVCGICKKPVDKSLRQPDMMCASLDHITPISVALAEGWPVEEIHTYANTQCSHLKCNLEKSRDLN